MPGTIRIGISGWRYEPWRGVFYPADLPQRSELAFASRRLSTIEINGSFYSLQRPEYYARWHDETPDGFVFSVKGGRYITHMRRLRDIEAPLANFLASGIANLGAKLGPFLWQFPPSFRFDADRLRAFLALLPRDTDAATALARRRDARLAGRARLAYGPTRPLRHAIEVRHESFETPAFVELLREQRIALVVADTAGTWPYAEDLTADFVYVRLHGDRELYVSGYTPSALERWAARIRTWAAGRQVADARLLAPGARAPLVPRDVYVYFDNDIKVKAPRDAMRLAGMLGVDWKTPPANMPARRTSRGENGSIMSARTRIARRADRRRNPWPPSSRG
jgi:uncharacterized protein YecE (DUF72 family)